MTPSSLLRPLAAFDHVTHRRSSFDGWFIEGVGTSADEPLDPGSDVLFNASATRTEDGPETITVPVLVNGVEQTDVTFSAAVTGVDTESFTITVPTDETTVTVDVGGESTTLDVGTSEPEPEEGTRSVSIRGPTSVEVDERVTYDVTISCFGGTCDGATLRIDVAGGTLFSQTRGPLEDGESLTESVTVGFDDTGTVEVFAVWGQETTSLTANVDVTLEFDPDLVTIPASDCSVSPQHITPQEQVDLSAVVRNRNDEGAIATVEWTWAGEPVADRQVVIGQSDTMVAETSTTIDREGSDQVRANVVEATKATEELLSPTSDRVRAGSLN